MEHSRTRLEFLRSIDLFCHNELLGRELSLGYGVFHTQSLFPLVYNICPFYLSNIGTLYKWNGKKAKLLLKNRKIWTRH